MSPQWRLFTAALRFAMRGFGSAGGAVDDRLPHEAARLFPLAGIAVGLVGAGVYWLAAQLWPTSVAVALSMLATTPGARASGGGGLYWVFSLLIKYNALMALSAANVPFSLPEHFALGLIMVAGHGASRALAVSVMATHAPAAGRMTATDLSLALILGLAPATLLGIPGLVGLAAAIAMRLGLSAYVSPKFTSDLPARLDVTQQLTEICFYLGALATWKYV
jgi:adenosylcobinamide-GDP ribazoletransferase